MNHTAPRSFSRRWFLQTSATAFGTHTLSDRIAMGAATETEIRSTDHFWYRLAPQGPYIDSQRDHRAFGFTDDEILLSEDNGRTWPHRAVLPDAQHITFSVLLKSGNIVFATREQLFLSTDNLETHHEIIVKGMDGSDYLPHKPNDPDRPGWYFHPLDGVHTWEVNGTEMLVWGNYGNVRGGAVPTNIYYSTDQGRTVKIAYSFGQNPKFQQPETPPGEMLGDPDNSVICRHIHCVTFHPEENAFYACTGDLDQGHGHECHWLRGTYDATTDRWDWKVLVSVDSNSRYKSGGIQFVSGQLYWASDANGLTLRPRHDRGIFRCDPKDLADPSKHTLLFDPEYESANMIIEDGFILSAHYTTASPYDTGFIVSPDLGRTWAQYDLKELGKRSPLRFHPKNEDGWFRVDLRSGWIDRAEVLFLKPKP